jgi:L-ascorbate metabolism protein UlaG (beta-lactamase superfamily)
MYKVLFILLPMIRNLYFKYRFSLGWGFMEYDFVKWLGHAGFELQDADLKIFIDPFRIKDINEKADLIFITHSHMDHLSIDDINKIATQKTSFIAPQEARGKLDFKNVRFVNPGETGEILGVKFETHAAYNTDAAKLAFHPAANKWVGYVIEVSGKRIYHSGDADIIDEMKNIKSDLALIPAGGTYTMDAQEAINATKIIDAKNFAPMHYKALLGKEKSKGFEENFKQKVKNSIIMQEIFEPFYSF